jgi:hypothetical protein
MGAARDNPQRARSFVNEVRQQYTLLVEQFAPLIPLSILV